ncbi:MAG: hypothetical protein PHF08_11560 [Candidatus Riflebacteria bacterium]|nr:hypothetical protein [Candidatus Riflebacteria bacterium]
MAPRKAPNKTDESPETKQKQKNKRRKAPLTVKSSNRSKSSGIIKKSVFIILISSIFILTFAIYVMLNSSKFIPLLGQFVTMSVSTITLNPETLTHKNTRALIHLKVKNTSIIPIYLDNFVFDMKIGDYQPAKNLKAITNIKLDDTKEITVPIACNLDSITTRRALQKTIEKNAGKVIKKLLDTTPVSKEAYGDDIKAVSKIKGNANMHVRLFGYALKFSKPCDHN